MNLEISRLYFQAGMQEIFARPAGVIAGYVKIMVREKTINGKKGTRNPYTDIPGAVAILLAPLCSEIAVKGSIWVADALKLSRGTGQPKKVRGPSAVKFGAPGGIPLDEDSGDFADDLAKLIGLWVETGDESYLPDVTVTRRAKSMSATLTLQNPEPLTLTYGDLKPGSVSYSGHITTEGLKSLFSCFKD